MSSIRLASFDIAETLGSIVHIGKIHGQHAHELFLDAIKGSEPNILWNLDFKNSVATDYAFVSAFLGPILDNYGKILPENVAIVVSCHVVTDRTHVLSGVAFKEGPVGLLDEVEAIRKIKELERYFVMFIPGSSSHSEMFEYVGTDENDLQQLLDCLEKKQVVCVDDIRNELDWPSNKVVHQLELLHKRRQTFLFGKQEEERIEPQYVSVLRIYKSGGRP